MSTHLETIRAAIGRLELQKRESTQDIWITGSNESWALIPPLTRAVTFHGYENADAELIITLHRTIDAQLSILKDAAEYLEFDRERPTPIYSWVLRAWNLAQAILDGDE